MIAVVSKDGFLTRGDDPHPSSWASEEDRFHYLNMLRSHTLYLMGSRTYEFSKKSLPASAKKIVMSHKANEMPQTSNVHFSAAAFGDILKQYEGSHDTLLVLGGASIYHQMIDQGLINEIHLTVEPLLLHSGTRLFEHESYFAHHGFRLVEEKQLNENGTKLVIYRT